jgi:hypothetical protein
MKTAGSLPGFGSEDGVRGLALAVGVTGVAHFDGHRKSMITMGVIIEN